MQGGRQQPLNPGVRWEQLLHARGDPLERDFSPYGRWLCRRWNATHEADEALQRLRIVFMAKHVGGLGTVSYRRVVFHEQDCSP